MGPSDRLRSKDFADHVGGKGNSSRGRKGRYQILRFQEKNVPRAGDPPGGLRNQLECSLFVGDNLLSLLEGHWGGCEAPTPPHPPQTPGGG